MSHFLNISSFFDNNLVNIKLPSSYSRLPTWMQGYIPKLFYVTEKASNYYPYTETEYTVRNLNLLW